MVALVLTIVFGFHSALEWEQNEAAKATAVQKDPWIEHTLTAHTAHIPAIIIWYGQYKYAEQSI